MTNKYSFTLLLFLILGASALTAQQTTDWASFNQTRLKKQKTAMTILGSWAVANMASGAILQTQTEGEARYFHQMNLIWNTVNLAIAGSSLLAIRRTDISTLDAAASIKAQHSLQKVLLFNAGVDVGYMALGLWYIERGKNAPTQQKTDRRKGYGKSIILQGAFLFAFDLLTVRALTKDNHRIPKLLEGLSFSGNGLYFQKWF